MPMRQKPRRREFDNLRSACVLRYPYLWARQADRGETEGRKPRPVAGAALKLRRSRMRKLGTDRRAPRAPVPMMPPVVIVFG